MIWKENICRNKKKREARSMKLEQRVVKLH